MTLNIGGKEAVRRFLYEHFMPTVMSATVRKAINLQREFSSYLRRIDVAPLVSDEMAEAWIDNLVDSLEQELGTWDGRGIPRPASFDDEGEGVILTWRHPNYTIRTGRECLGADYFDILRWLRDLGPRDFLAVNVVLLAELGATRVHITEGSGDEGVDLIGVVKSGPFRSTGLLVQAKTSNSRISRNAVLLEYAKYASLPRSSKFREYLGAIDIGTSIDGSCLIYIITANNSFETRAQRLAAKVGVLLRSDIQLANSLKVRYGTLDGVLEMHERMRGHLGRNLEDNVARLL